eukprot:CAMPEP_0181334260 /NCGR_PEP_ID=MMETSP1101-20121128/26148_1 /TAXON_ID=46948 /ORGANISM="Rhodomonas abbreviata, Strain Caron Lab Isolate" /LENGTH=385 /DNA_ID=CAMNT_0023444191 /DNA_START=26 /DNA_END=1183 /DNA_ORIENTATION=+
MTLSRATFAIALILALGIVAQSSAYSSADVSKKAGFIHDSQMGLREMEGSSDDSDSDNMDEMDDSGNEADSDLDSGSGADSDLDASDGFTADSDGESDRDGDSGSSDSDRDGMHGHHGEGSGSEHGNHEDTSGEDTSGKDTSGEDMSDSSGSETGSGSSSDEKEPPVLAFVEMAVSLDMEMADFDESAQDDFKNLIATMTDADPENVIILDVSEEVMRRRVLLAQGIKVNFKVGVPSAQVEDTIANLSESSFETALAASPLPSLPITTVSVREAPTVQYPTTTEGEKGRNYTKVAVVVGSVVGVVALLIGGCVVWRVYTMRRKAAPPTAFVGEEVSMEEGKVPFASPVEAGAVQSLCYAVSPTPSPVKGGQAPVYFHEVQKPVAY